MANMSKRGSVRVTNMRVSMAPDAQPEGDESVVVIDRSNSVLGNRHILYRKSDLRERVIQASKDDLDADQARDGAMATCVRAGASRPCVMAICWRSAFF